MKHDLDAIKKCLVDQLTYTEVAKRLGMTKSNVAKIAAQLRMEQSRTIGSLDLDTLKRRYIDDAEPFETIVADSGVSAIQLRRYLQAHNLFRDRGAIYRAGTKEKLNKGIRVPGSVRDRKAKAPKFMSDDHREKLATAKRGRTGEQANRWKGGHEAGGYEAIGGGTLRRYVHRTVAEDLLQRPLHSSEQVHHIDRNRKNNAPVNLLVLGSADHTKLHVAMRKNDGLDQCQWLIDNNIQFEDLIQYAQDRKQ